MGASAASGSDTQPESGSGAARVCFSDYTIDLRSGELTTNNKKIYLQQQPLEVLRLLLERPGEMVSREELRQRLWPGDTFVDFDHGLNKAVQKLRTALGDSSEAPRFVETLPRRGYRFIAPVQPAQTEPIAPPTGAIAGVRPARTLRWVGIAGMVLVALLTTYLIVRRSAEPQDAGQAQVHRLVVLPLENLSGDAGQEYFSDGMTDELISQLSRIAPQRLAVIARSSAMTYKQKRKTAAEIGRELNVNHILEGSVRREGGRVRISVRLISVGDQSPVWTGSYERELSGMLPVQEEIATNVAREIGLKLNDTDVRWGKRAINPEAYDAFLRGLYLLHTGRMGEPQRSIEHFQRAIGLEPEYALAHAWLAFAYNLLSSGDQLPPQEGYALAKAAALRAIEIDPHLPEAHAALGFILRSYEWDWKGADAELRKAVEAGPNTAVAHHVHGLYLSTVGRHDEAIAAMNRAATLDPLSPVVVSSRAAVYANARRFDEARAIWEGRPDAAGLSRSWPNVLIANGKFEEALALLQAAPNDPKRWEVVSGKARVYAALGRTGEARAILTELKGRPETRGILSPHIALIHMQLGEHDEAFRWLDVAVQERAARVIYLKVDPAWDKLRGDARFEALLRRMNFTE